MPDNITHIIVAVVFIAIITSPIWGGLYYLFVYRPFFMNTLDRERLDKLSADKKPNNTIRPWMTTVLVIGGIYMANMFKDATSISSIHMYVAWFLWAITLGASMPEYDPSGQDRGKWAAAFAGTFLVMVIGSWYIVSQFPAA